MWDTAPMPTQELRPQTPSGSTGRSESVDGRLLQERLRLFGGLAFLISAVFYAVGQVLAWLGRENPPTLAGRVALFAILLLMGGTWLYCRGGPRPERTLRAFDVVLLLVISPASRRTRAGVPRPRPRRRGASSAAASPASGPRTRPGPGGWRRAGASRRPPARRRCQALSPSPGPSSSARAETPGQAAARGGRRRRGHCGPAC
jgi:hypothetical protein